MTRKVVYNDCYGGFCLSYKAIQLALSLGGNKEEYESGCPNCRHDPILVQVVEQLGQEASTSCSDLRIVEVVGPYRIEEDNGNESVMTPDDYHFV